MGQKLLLLIIACLISFSFSSEVTAAEKTPKKQQCTAARPATPVLVSATAEDASVTLVWNEVADPVTHYLLQYGRSKENLEYGSQNIGARGTTTYTVYHLSNGMRYYFQILAVNQCRPGDNSNTISVVAGKKVAAGLKIPRLSFYKPVLSTSESAEPEEATKTPVITSHNMVPMCTNGCLGWQLLVGEALALLVFFMLAHRFSFMKPIFSVTIPIAVGLFSFQINGKCQSQEFFCRYFLLLNMTLFMLIVVFERQRLIHVPKDLL